MGLRRVDLAPDTCADDRYPALAGPWIVGCSDSGRVDLAVSVETGLRVVLADAVTRPGLTDGALFGPGVGVWTLPDPRPRRVTPMVTEPPIAPPAFDGVRVALTYPDGVEVFALGESVRKRTAARPRPWIAPVLRGPDVAWIDADGARIRTVDGEVHHFAAGPGGAPVDRGVAGDGRRVRFSGDGASVGVGERLRTVVGDPVDTAFDAPLTMSGPVTCFETRPEGGSPGGVSCLGGRLPGGQTSLEGHHHPSLVGPWLLSRTDDGVWLSALTELTLTRGDLVDRDDHPPRPPGDCGGGATVWDLDWPAPGWEAEIRGNDGSTEVVPLRPGHLLLTAPCAQSATLRPEGPA